MGEQFHLLQAKAPNEVFGGPKGTFRMFSGLHPSLYYACGDLPRGLSPQTGSLWLLATSALHSCKEGTWAVQGPQGEALQFMAWLFLR